jgi:D-arabinose 1-dehydrogenase-like Zn-dependent alcohol dehydrogenase
VSPLNGWALTGPNGQLTEVHGPLPEPGPGEVRVRVAGCGLCHTDLGFAFDGVRTRKPLPLVLGHEISGLVEAAGAGAEELVGRGVVVPAVIPCGECDDCRAGAPMICTRQVMPGNDIDGGFASHVVVPARGLCVVPGAGEDFDRPLGASGVTLRHLAVIADAASTPYQAVVRSGLQPGDVAIVVGLGGVGGSPAPTSSASTSAPSASRRPASSGAASRSIRGTSAPRTSSRPSPGTRRRSAPRPRAGGSSSAPGRAPARPPRSASSCTAPRSPSSASRCSPSRCGSRT